MRQESGRVLLVDDDPLVRRGYERALVRQGWTVETATDGTDAAARVKTGGFDVIVSDLTMPGFGGIQFLRAVRELGLDIPIILLTGRPTIDSTISAIEHGAFRYLIKPVAHAELDETVSRAAQLSKLASLRRRALELVAATDQRMEERVALNGRFENALGHMWVAFQPIVSWRERKVFGYEALLRTDDATLANPVAFLDAAERLGRVGEVGRAVRNRVADASAAIDRDAKLFVNLHASDLDDASLFDLTSPLSTIAHRVVLEVTERASLETIPDVSGRIKRLKDLGFRIAIDDLGAGYAGLASFTQLEPAVAKLDMSLVRGIDTHNQKQCIVRAMKALCDELGIEVIAEGVETVAERDMLVSLGCDLFQGYLFGRPARTFTPPNW